MKRRGFRKFGAALTAAAAAAALMPVMPQGTTTVYAAQPDVTQFATKEQLMTSFDTDDTDGEANGKKIYFGWNDLWGEPQSWWIVGQDPADTEGNGLVLLSSTPLIHDQKFDSETDQFQDIPYDPAWGAVYDVAPDAVRASHYGASEVRLNVLKPLETNLDYFSSSEQRMMVDTEIATDDFLNGNNYVLTDKLYLPYGELTTNFILAGSNSKADLVSGLHVDTPYWGSVFWLRTPHAGTYVGMAANNDIVGDTRVDLLHNVHPALQVDLSTVAFASSAPSASTLETAESGSLTIDKDNTFTLRHTGGEGSAVIDPTGTFVEVSGAPADAYLVVQNSEGAWATAVNSQDRVQISEVTIAGASLNSFGGCRVWLESTDADRITTAVMAESRSDFSVSVTGGNHMTKTPDSGAETQTVPAGSAMTPVVYTADEGYHFPADYVNTLARQTGVTVVRDSDTQITVSGTPAGDVSLMLPDAQAETVMPTYTIMTDITTLDFAAVSEGYGTSPAAGQVTVTNTGNSAVNLVQPVGTNFNIGALSSVSLAPGGTATFTVQPKTGLAAGAYNEMITIATDQGTSVQVNARFTVNAAVATPVTEPSPSGAAQTGDNSSYLLYMFMLAVSLAAAGIAGRRLYRQNR